MQQLEYNSVSEDTNIRIRSGSSYKFFDACTMYLKGMDKWFNTNSEFLFYIILLGFTFVLAMLTAIAGWTTSTDFLDNSALYAVVLDSNEPPDGGGYPLMSYFFAFAAIYVVIGIHCLISLTFEVFDGAMRNRERRMGIVARAFAHGAFVVPAILMLAFSNNPRIFTWILIQNLVLQLYIVIISVTMVACRQSGSQADLLVRPIVLIPMNILISIAALGACSEYVRLSPGVKYFKILNALIYILGAFLNVTSFINSYRAIRGEELPGEVYDGIAVVFSVTAWLISYRIINGYKSKAPLAVGSEDIDFSAYIFYRFGAGAAFMFLWQLRSTYVTLKRIESEEDREMAIQSRILYTEQRMAIKILHSMVPARIADDLTKGRLVAPEMFHFATVFFSDIVGFTKFAAVKTPLEVFSMLNRLFRVMDFCVARFPKELYKIETIGDAYMVVGGLNDIDNTEEDESESWRQNCIADATCKFALLVREAVQMVPFDEISFVKIRIGVHCGPILAGISGTMVPRFSCFGDTVNTASRMESTGLVSKIHLSGVFGDMIRRMSSSLEYSLEPREVVEVKGKGCMQTYFLETDMSTFREKFSDSLKEVDNLIMSFRSENYTLSDKHTIVLEPKNLNPIPLNGISFSSLEYGSGEGTIPFKFEEMALPNFNVLQIDVDDISGIDAAILMLIEGIVGSKKCHTVTNPSTLVRLIHRCGKHYRRVPYHNWHHAFCVVQSTAAFLRALNLDSQLDEKCRFILMLAALVHDIDHPGHNNSFEVRQQTSLALLYNDQSVLENHHLSLAFNIMLNNSYNVFQNWNKSDAAVARKMLIACVLATDMDVHSLLKEELHRRASFSPVFDLKNQDDITTLCKCLLHAADISNPTRPFHVSSSISMFALEEFNMQAEEEKALGLTVSEFMITTNHASKCQSELYFIGNIAKPYFFELKRCFQEASWDPVAAIDKNIELWREQESKYTCLTLSELTF